MGLDPNYLRLLAASNPAFKLQTARIAPTDHAEAKANIIATRVIESDPVAEMLQEEERIEELAREEIEDEESYESELAEASGWHQPIESEAGLISTEIVPDESQVAAVDGLIQEQYGCLIGAAGSGKTTTTKILVHKLVYGDEKLGIKPHRVRLLPGKQGPSIALVAFTGIATQVIKQNMPSWLHAGCKTIHSLLEYSPVETIVTDKDGKPKETMVFMPTRTRHNKLQHDLIIIDEYSMVGADLWHQLLDACLPGTRIIAIGDLNQLPPVMSQSVFPYILADWPVFELTKIHRQKEPAANRIIETAHAILQGNKFKFDESKDNPNWRVIGFEISPVAQKAGIEIVAIASALRNRRVDKSIDPTEPLIYDPYRDRIITAGNGLDENNSGASVEQFIINEALSQIIEPPTDENPRIIIDAGLSRKKFAIHHRVMATRNEPPSVVDRITNGMVGIIKEINRNPGWSGDLRTVGPEKQVEEHRKESLNSFFKGKSSVANFDSDSIQAGEVIEEDDYDFDPTSIKIDVQAGIEKGMQRNKEGGGAASHSILVEFANGATRIFSSKNQVHSLMLAYASTCHKCQGSQMDTAIVVVHHAAKRMLCREWLYTAVTRAQKRVVLLYTTHGLQLAMARQKIFGRTLEEKIRKYKEFQEEQNKELGGLGKLMGAKAKIRLRIEEGAE